MTRIVKAFLPPVILGIIASFVFLIPKNTDMEPSAISPDFPLQDSIPGWWGVRKQESEKERRILAPDTQFSKADYTQLRRVPWEKPPPPVDVSIVYSGQDMNASIHRPERCLPAQGHVNLQYRETELTLANQRLLKISRIASKIQHHSLNSKYLNFIHYYVFIGADTVCHKHTQRTFRDLLNRVMLGRTQRWAYFQAGTYWAPELGISEDEADQRLRKLISELLPRQIDWDKVK